MIRHDDFPCASAGMSAAQPALFASRSAHTRRRGAAAIFAFNAAETGRPRGRFACMAALAAVLCAGCDTSPTRGDYPAERPGERRMQFTCRDGEQVDLHILEAQGIAVLTRGGRTLRMKEQSTESGFIYSDGRNSMRRKGRDLRLEIVGTEPVECRSASE